MPLLFEPSAPEAGEDPLADHKRLMRRLLCEVSQDLAFVRLIAVEVNTILFSPSRQPRFDVYKAVQYGLGGVPLTGAPVYVLFRNAPGGHVQFSQLRDAAESKAA